MFNFKSRKFQLVLAAALVAVAGAVTGEMTWSTAILSVVASFATNILGIAIEDAGAKSGVK
jgi:hypothetical protein